MSNLKINVASNNLDKQIDDSTQTNLLDSPMLASICVAICIFCWIILVFFGLWQNILYAISSKGTTGGLDDFLVLNRGFINQIIFFISVLFIFANYVGFLSIGIMKKWLGYALLALVGFCVFLELIDWLPIYLFGIDIIPELFYGNMWLFDVPFYIYIALALFLIPLSFFISNLKAKAIPIWKSVAFLVIPTLTFLIGIVPNILLIGMRDPTTGWNWVLFALGMTLWILFTVVIITELRITKTSKSYLWLTISMSLGALILSFLFLTIFTIYTYLNIPESKTQIFNYTEIRKT